MAPVNLQQVLQPISLQGFFGEYWGKQFFYQQSDKSRFKELLPWPALNEILESHRLDHPRLRLAKDGETVPASKIINHEHGRRDISVPRIRAEELTNQLREGATLIVDAIDETYGPLKQFVLQLEKTFRERIQVNAYVGWGTTKGFDLHWDDHDVLIMQIDGRKAWKIYGETRKWPLYRDKVLDFPAPEKPIWEATLESGDFLYIPRGWWHVATAIGEPTLHLTFGINNRNGIHFLNWVEDCLIEEELFRMDLPQFEDLEVRRAHSKRLKEKLLEIWDDNLLERFLHSRDAKVEPRPSLSLPWAATKDVLPLTEPFFLRSILPRTVRIDIDSENNIVTFEAIGKIFRFAVEAKPLLDRVLSGQKVSIEELEQVAPTVTREEAVDFVKELVTQGVLKIEPVS